MNLYMHIWRFDPNSFICKRPFFAKKRLRSRIFPEPDVYLSRGSHVIIFHQIFRQNKTTFANSEKNFRGVSCWNPGGLSLHGPFDRQSFIEKINLYIFIEGSLEVKFPTIWTDGKQRWDESEKRRAEERRSEKRKSEKKEDAGARKGRKVTIRCVFPMICGSGRSKSRLAKAACAEPCGQMKDEKVHPVAARSTFPSQNVQKGRTTFGSWDVETVHAVVARSTFPSQNVPSTPGSEHFWKFRGRKSDDVVARSTFPSQKCKKLTGTEHFWTFRCRFAWPAQRIVHLVKSEQNVMVF